MQRWLFLVIVFSVVILVPLYLTWVHVRAFDLKGIPRVAAFGLTLVLIASLVAYLPLSRSMAPSLLLSIWTWTAYLTFGFFSFLLTWTLFGGLLGGLLRVVALAAGRGGGGSGTLLGAGGSLSILGASLFCTVLGVWFAQRRPPLVSHEVVVPGLEPALDGITLVQITDLHIGNTIGRRFAEDVVNVVNAANPDFILLTGDVADGMPDALAEDIEPLRRLEARRGKFYVTGNHEYYWNASAWMDAMRGLGFRVFENDGIMVDVGSARVLFAGVPDLAPDVVRAWLAAGRETPDYSVLLAHQPHVATQAAEAGFDFTLVGHTHGGQFFPWNIVIKWIHTYSKGMYDVGTMKLYVSPGTGYWGPPLRLGSPSEVTRFVLKSAPPLTETSPVQADRP